MTAREVTEFLRDRGEPAWKRYLGIFAALYVASPLDLIPDWIPLVGWLDDLGVLGLCAWYFVRQVRQHAVRRAALPPSTETAP